MTAPEPAKRTALLGSFADFEADVVLQILEANGIYAIPKNPTTESEHAPWPGVTMSSRGMILVDAERLDEARAVITEELPRYIASLIEDGPDD